MILHTTSNYRSGFGIRTNFKLSNFLVQITLDVLQKRFIFFGGKTNFLGYNTRGQLVIC